MFDVEPFNYERSLWDNVVLEQLRSNPTAVTQAIAFADAVIAARRNTFTQETN